MATGTEPEQHLYDMIKDFDTAMLMTRSSSGRMHGRPMAVAKLERDSDLYFAADGTSSKCRRLRPTRA